MTPRHYPLIAMVVAALGCETGPTTETLPPPCVQSDTLTISDLVLEMETDLGTVRGVDLDDRASDAADRRGCYHEDWEDPDGSSVDNGFATLGPTIEAAYPTDPRGIFESDSLVLDVAGRGDGVCAAVSVTLGEGPRRTAEWNGSTLRAYHLGDVPLRLTLPEASSGTVVLRDAAVRITLTAEGRIATVVLSGAVEIDELVPVAADSTIGFDASLIRTTLEGVADLEPNERGLCTRISVAFDAATPT